MTFSKETYRPEDITVVVFRNRVINNKTGNNRRPVRCIFRSPFYLNVLTVSPRLNVKCYHIPLPTFPTRLRVFRHFSDFTVSRPFLLYSYSVCVPKFV